MPIPPKDLTQRQATMLAAIDGAGPEGITVSRLMVATGLTAKQVNDTTGELLRWRLVRSASSGRPICYVLTAEGEARVKIWHAMRGDKQNRPRGGGGSDDEAPPSPAKPITLHRWMR